MHFVGATKKSNQHAHLLFQFWGHAPLDQLSMIAQQNVNAQDDPSAGTGAVRKPTPTYFAADDFECYFGAVCKAPTPWDLGPEIENHGVYIKEKK